MTIKKTVMREIKHVRQVEGEPHRKWYASRTFDLIVWFAPGGKEVHGFQLCYRVGHHEKALTWFKGRGFSHKRVDDGETGGSHYKMTPILVPDGVFDKSSIVGLFEKASKDIEEPLRGEVLQLLEEYGEK